jgi:hypothetical protein
MLGVMKKTLFACILALAVSAPALAASFTGGKYTGKTSQVNKNTGKHRKISFRADAADRAVRNLKFVATGKCSDGGHSSSTQKGLRTGDVNSDGEFKIRAQRNGGAVRVKVDGELDGTAAHGTLSVKSRFSASTGQPDPYGTVTCTTGKVDWSAKKTAD